VATRRQLQLGLGVDDPDQRTSPRAGRDGPTPAAGDPYLVCLGRVDRHKGTSLLAALFAAYKQRHPGPLRLVLAGPVVEAPGFHPDIDVVGPVTEDEKWALLAGAVALLSPSPWEAFSLVVAEAWSARTPVVVNAACAATVEHCRRSGGGLSFAGFGQFEAVVELLCEDEQVRGRLGRRGRAYVDRWFRWPRIIDRYAAFVEAVVDTVVPSEPSAQGAGTGPRHHVDPEHGGAGEDLVDPEAADRLGSGHR
jgi:glycosyltransferase involved in cell wall biosynthesis